MVREAAKDTGKLWIRSGSNSLQSPTPTKHLLPLSLRHLLKPLPNLESMLETLIKE